MGFFFKFPPTTKNYLSTHTLRHTYISNFKKVFLPYDCKIPASSFPQGERQSLLIAQICCTNILYKAPVWYHRQKGQGQMEWILRGICFLS